MPDRRRSLWVDSLIDTTVVSSGEAVDDLLASLPESEARLSRLTLVRTIVGIDIAYSVHDAGEGSQRGAFGICGISREAFSAGVASLPHPDIASDHPTLPWVVRAVYRIYGFAADQPAIFTRRVDLDIRSQRKVDNGTMVMVMTNNPVEGVTTTILFSGMVRQLYLV